MKEKKIIYLYGPAGSGKTTIGRSLAVQLDRSFIDLDTLIVEEAGCSIAEIFSQKGEPYFRELEERMLRGIDMPLGGVIALGGGALLNQNNRVYCEMTGEVVLLQASVEEIYKRIQAQPNERPLLEGEGKEALRKYLGGRQAHYEEFSQVVDTTGLSVDEIVWDIENNIGTHYVRGMGLGYDVRIRNGLLTEIGKMLQSKGVVGPIALVTDKNLYSIYGEQLEQIIQKAGFVLHTIVLPPGEKLKTLHTIEQIWEGFLAGKLERGSTAIAFGGGVIGDMTGFAAATYLRGIKWIAVPTSLLAMVDASLGGKTGADLPAGKNLIGAFYPPLAVWMDPSVLNTLSKEEFTSGKAEVVKHGVIGDIELFEEIERGGVKDLERLVRRAVSVKIKVIQEDPFEGGKREVLNLGHTIGHAVELVSGFSVKHGEGVSIGMVKEAEIAEEIGIAEIGTQDRIRACLINVGLPVELPAGMDKKELLKVMRVDKKVKGGQVRFSMPVRIGKVITGVIVEDLERFL